MTKEDIKSKFDNLYAYMAMSNNPKHMVLFGEVMKEMMCWMTENKQEVAEKMVEKLCSVKWKQYLTRDEAMDIAKEMKPAPAWDYDGWHKLMKEHGLECERQYVFNTYALWIVMNAMHSDNGSVIAGLMHITPTDTGNAEYIKIVHCMSMNLILDEDGVYSVRRYFFG